MSAEPTPQEKQLAVAISAMRAARDSLSMALELIGTLHPGKPAPQEGEEEQKKYFGKGARGRPTAAVGAEPPQTED